MAARFLAPDYELHTHKPEGLTDLGKAADLVVGALERGETIGIFGDYDCDGIPAAVLFHDLLKKQGQERIPVYIPHRNREGFGFSKVGVDSLIADGAKIIVTVDCGTADSGAVEYAKSKGLTVIITDHHEPPESGLPPADAVVNPRRADCKYPDKGLCGSAVAWKLAQAVIARRPVEPVGWEKWLLDMVGLATLADMVPLTGENRVLASYGLQVMRKSRRPGLRALLAAAKVEQATMGEDDATFSIAPRINAASRMGEPEVAFRLLTTESVEEARRLAAELGALNDSRKGVVSGMVRVVRERIEQRGEVPAAIVAGDPRWSPSLLGLAAGTIAGEYGRPVFLWGRGEGDALRGSCRAAPGGASALEMLRLAADCLESFGGHHAAGGFVVKLGEVDNLPAALAAAASAAPSADFLGAVADATLSPGEVTPALADLLARLSPFGVGNEKPLFLFPEAEVLAVRFFGIGNTHARLTLVSDSGRADVIGFFRGAEVRDRGVAKGGRISVLGSVERSSYGGRTELRLRLAELL